jgi:mannose-6-phosphate isomerase-like protein (cupin superfamily)
MTAAIVDAPHSEQAQGWWFLDTLVVEHRQAPGMKTAVFEMTLPVGSSPPAHVHQDLDDSWYVLEGQMALRCGNDELVAGPGSWVSLPRGVPHTFRVVGDRPARILSIHDDPSFLEFVRAVGAPTTERVVPDQPLFPPVDEWARVATAHGLTLAGPPMSDEDALAVVAASEG